VELLASREVVVVSRFVGGDLQAQFMARVRGSDPAACLVVPVDVGKWSAMALVADHHGEIWSSPGFPDGLGVVIDIMPQSRSGAAGRR
jgi:hypothetical protein